jgi:hypothetical protein
MTTFTSEDRQKAYDIEDREDRERMLREQNRILNEEIQSLKVKLAQTEKRAEGWKDAYHNVMDLLGAKK